MRPSLVNDKSADAIFFLVIGCTLTRVYYVMNIKNAVSVKLMYSSDLNISRYTQACSIFLLLLDFHSSLMGKKPAT